MGERLYQIRRARAPVPGPGSAGEAEEAALLDRRQFMHLAGTTLALASGCAAEVPRKIVPYTRTPRDVVPGTSTFYATSMALDGYASGLLVESREGRPIKIEANPDHPATLGGTSAFEQASIRQLYDDDRGRSVRDDGGPSSWEDLFTILRAPRADRGRGLRILMEPTASLLLLDLLQRVRERHPEARLAFHAAARGDADVEGARIAFGRPLLPQYDLSRASAVLSLDADFLTDMPFSRRYARQWAERRRLASTGGPPARLYMVESQLSVTGTMADNRLRCPLSQLPPLALALAARLSLPGAPAARPRTRPLPSDRQAWAQAAAADLGARGPGQTLILAGSRQPPPVHALAYAMNQALGNIGQGLTFTAPLLPLVGGAVQSFADQVADMRGGRVDTLVIVEANPVYTAPADLGYREALRRVPQTLCFSYHEHETAESCRWFAPAAHYLETWGDGRAYDGTISMIQPLVTPLVGARTAAELLAALAGAEAPDAYSLAHDFWVSRRGLTEEAWERAVQLGLQPGSALPLESPSVNGEAVTRSLAALATAPPPADAGRVEVELYTSPTVHDGRFANNPWLQEQPTPIGKLTWDNAAIVSPETARRFGLATQQIVELRAAHATVWAPVLIVPGVADGVVVAWLGYGRGGHEPVAAGAGFNAYPLRTSGRLHFVPEVRLVAHEQRYPLAITQEHWYTHDRPIALRRTLAEYRRDPRFTEPYRGPAPSMVPAYQYEGNQWAMSIDLGICTGCSACTIACQAENNIPVVGKGEVLKSREMNWLRIDSYFFGTPEEPRLVHQPMMCQHCEKAPCEYVCPVEATEHSPDGLNEMIYNRCVGTRFCSNNCPYKVRRFNWFDWGERVGDNRGLAELQYNPEVTVRERGVMEKCTYCVQRIRGAEIRARLEERDLRPGEVVTACQAACPTGAIQFGSLAHRDSEMVRRREEDRSYAVLQREEGTQPRTYYLARIDDPNEELG